MSTEKYSQEKGFHVAPSLEPKSDLYVFKRKELGIFFIVLILVALLAFTFGLRLGKNLALHESNTHTGEEHPSAHTETAGDAHEKLVSPVDKESSHETSAHDVSHVEAKNADSAAHPVRSDVETTAPTDAAETKADQEFAKEVEKSKGVLNQKVVTQYPSQKKGELGANFTLQVGSHRTVAEATEQVALLKRRGLEAFYKEVAIQGKGTWYRVGIGVFSTKEEAEKTGVEWGKSKDLPPYLIQKVSE